MSLTYNHFLSRSPLPLRPVLADKLNPPIIINPFTGDVSKWQFPIITTTQAEQYSQDPQALLVDARSAALFAQGHIPHAANLPVSQFAMTIFDMLSKLQKAKVIVTYCSEFTCNDSLELAQSLADYGFRRIMVYKGGIKEWLQNGHALEK
jgi:rhodanese-related sulfurtransferase